MVHEVGDATKIEVKDARRIAAKLVADVAEGKDPQAEKMAKRGASSRSWRALSRAGAV